MALVKIKKFAQITLPTSLRKKYNLLEGDYIEVEDIGHGLLLKPVAVVEKDKAWQEIFKASKKVQDTQPTQNQSPEEQEKEITHMVKDFRKKQL